jgi:AcrR family transcriptional regulator
MQAQGNEDMAISSTDKPDGRSQRARVRALETASALFYANGVRAVGMEQIVEESGIAKTTIYRHFPTKDALIEAFLEKEDAEFWSQWDTVIGTATTSLDQIEALCDWIGERVRRDAYRGCPQLNVAAEFADGAHPARLVARRHKAEMHRRLEEICARGGVVHPGTTAMQIALLFDGAFMSDGRLSPYDAPALLKHAVDLLIDGGRARADSETSAEPT